MSESEKVSAISPEYREMAEQHTILSSMVLTKQEQLRTLQHEESITVINLQRLRREHEDAVAQQGIKLQQQRAEHARQLEEEKLAFHRYKSEVESKGHNLLLWEQDLKQQEAKVEPLKQQEQALLAQRIEVEKLYMSASEAEQRASRLESVYNNQVGDLLARETEVKRLEDKHTVLAQELDASKTALDRQAQQVELELANLLKIREEIDPKLKVLLEKEQTVQEQLIRAESLHAEAVQKHAEQQETLASLQAFSTRLEAKEKLLNEKELQVSQREKDAQLRETAAKDS